MQTITASSTTFGQLQSARLGGLVEAVITANSLSEKRKLLVRKLAAVALGDLDNLMRQFTEGAPIATSEANATALDFALALGVLGQVADEVYTLVVANPGTLTTTNYEPSRGPRPVRTFP